MDENVLTFNFNGYTLIFEHGPHDAPPPANNLYAQDASGNRVWEMSKIANPNDSAVLVREIDEKSFYFATFFGLGYTIGIPSFEIAETGISK